MSEYLSEYSQLIMNENIRYLPTCLIMEIMSSVHGYVIRVPIKRRILEVERFRIIEVLEIFYSDLANTAETYNSGRMCFFPGDWKTNRLKAQRLFTAVMRRLDRLHYFFWGPPRAQLKQYMSRLSGVWLDLCAVLDEKSRHHSADVNCGATTRYFHSSDVETWQRTMANIISDLHADTGAEDGEYLLLICCAGIKARLLTQIEQLRAKRGESRTFDENCILCVSHSDCGVTCPNCMRFSDEIDPAAGIGQLEVPTPFPLHPAYQALLMREYSESLARDGKRVAGR